MKEQFKFKQFKNRGPENVIQEAIINLLKIRDWVVKSTHGNEFQFGFPDLYAAHRKYGSRWIEVKNPLAYCFTGGQLEFFPQLESVGVGVWVLIAATQEEYDKLFKSANWRQYWMAKCMGIK